MTGLNRAAREYVPVINLALRTAHLPPIVCTCTPSGAEDCPVPHNVWLGVPDLRRGISKLDRRHPREAVEGALPIIASQDPRTRGVTDVYSCANGLSGKTSLMGTKSGRPRASNRYAGSCGFCGAWVAAGEGTSYKDSDDRWHVAC
jgi:hypothetical protein